MSDITRRDFLATAIAAFGVAVVHRYETHLEEHDEPLIEAPANPKHNALRRRRRPLRHLAGPAGHGDPRGHLEMVPGEERL